MTRSLSILAAFLLLATVCRTVSAAPAADAVYLNGRFYTVESSQPWATAVAIQKGRFVYVGDEAGARAHVGRRTQIVDLKGRMAMPGIHDAHTHLLWAGLAANFGCRLPPGPFGETHVAALKECEKVLKPGDWLVAGLFTTDQFPNGRPDRKYLDAAFPDRPVYLRESTVHNGLANSKALEIAGIDERTADPFGGTFVRDPDGRITGEVVETASAAVTSHIPDATPEQKRKALEYAVRTCNRLGITSVQDASGEVTLLRALRDLESAGALTMDVGVQLIWGSKTFLHVSEADTDALIAGRDAYASPHVDVAGIKMWIDGTPTPPYYTEAGINPHTHAIAGDHVLIPPARLNEAVKRFDAAGMRVKMHVAGAGAAHAALDAIAAARKANGAGARSHELAHTNLVLPEDMDRMHALNVVGEMSPAVWHLYGDMLGRPPQRAWQFRTLASKGVLMTVGTDWAVMDEPNLFPALQGILQHKDESLDLPSAIRMYTINGAKAVGSEKDRGSIAVGKRANFIVLDRNLLEIPVEQVGGAKVLRTVFEGATVYTTEAAR